MRSEPVFAIYKGDEFVDVGTREELMEHMGWKKSITYLYTSKRYRSGKVTDRNNPYVVIVLEGGK